MKVLLLNGSPHAAGCTFTALCEVKAALNGEGVEADIIHCGKQTAVCTVCGYCRRSDPPRCIYDDVLNTVLAKLDEYDALVLGSPVHYAAASGLATAFFDRLFWIAGSRLAFKPGAAVVSARRAGTTAALDQLNKYFTISNMLLVGSQYWNMVHGACPEDVKQDIEGMQTMRQLGRNMAWLLRSIAAGREAGIEPPVREQRLYTNFIRG